MTKYIDLITSEHRGQPRFEATVKASVSPFEKLQSVFKSLPENFDIDTAVGVQLDTLGIWIGRSRRIDTPLIGIYFTWDDTVATGWENGVWQGEFDPTSGLIDLPDDAYRQLLKAKIAANSWDGTIPDAYDIWESAFGNDSTLIIQDNQNMSMVVGIAGEQLSTVTKELLIKGYLPLKPQGVRIAYYAVAPSAGLLFGWDLEEGDGLAGWDIGLWATELTPE
jgi:hypothetical protein